jgi:hypothetical protein
MKRRDRASGLRLWVTRSLPFVFWIGAALLGSCRLAMGAQGPANNTFANRIVLAGTNITVTGSNFNATKESGEPDHAGNSGGKSVWWSWAATADGELQLNSDGSGFDTLLGIYTGTRVSSLNLIASNDDHGPFVTSRVRLEVNQGTNYEIAVDGFNDGALADSGDITLNLIFQSGPILRPTNDNFAARIALSGLPVIATGTNVAATREPGEPAHAGQAPTDSSVWWSWTASATASVSVSTGGSAFDTVLAVYRGAALSNLTELAANDDADPANGILTSTATFDAAAGESFQIAVDGFDGASGGIVLTLAPARALLTAPLLQNSGGFQFDINGAPGRIYEIQGCQAFSPWTGLGAVAITNGVGVFVDRAATNFSQRAYRAVLQPIPGP